MRVLLHVCCGPCAVLPIQRLLDEGHELSGFFFNPNIHPLAEYLRRQEGAAQVAEKYGLKMYWATEAADYNTAAWLRLAGGPDGDFSAPGRCRKCWAERLGRVCALAALEKFEAFSTSLLYSRRQRHAEIAALAADFSRGGIGWPLFLYRDFRADWKAGIELSKAWGIYRQQYCGCIFSENDRYGRDLQRSNPPMI